MHQGVKLNKDRVVNFRTKMAIGSCVKFYPREIPKQAIQTYCHRKNVVDMLQTCVFTYENGVLFSNHNV